MAVIRRHQRISHCGDRLLFCILKIKNFYLCRAGKKKYNHKFTKKILKCSWFIFLNQPFENWEVLDCRPDNTFCYFYLLEEDLFTGDIQRCTSKKYNILRIVHGGVGLGESIWVSLGIRKFHAQLHGYNVSCVWPFHSSNENAVPKVKHNGGQYFTKMGSIQTT